MLIRIHFSSLLATVNDMWTKRNNMGIALATRSGGNRLNNFEHGIVVFQQMLTILLISLTLSCQNLTAAEIDRLYEAEVIAKSDLQKDRQNAIRHALEIVLTRILAGDQILQDKTVRIILADANRYVSEYQYSLVSTNNNENTNTRLIRILFNEKLLVDILRSSQLEFWNEIRTRTLVWLVVEEDGNKQFFESTLMPEVDAAMTKASLTKALPVLYPIQDLKEQRVLSINDVLSAYSEHLLEVSSRYDVVSTLAGKITKNDHCWQAEWTLYFNEKIEQWKSQCGFINNATLNGFQGVYDHLSKYYSVKSKTQTIESTIIKIANIKGISTLEYVANYLESLPIISTATWIGAEEGYNLYRIFVLGKPFQLSNKLTKDRILSVENFSQHNSSEVIYKLISPLH